MVKIKWLGNEETLIRETAMGEKKPIKKGEVADVDDLQAEFYLKKGMGFELVTADVKAKEVARASVEEVKPVVETKKKVRK